MQPATATDTQRRLDQALEKINVRIRLHGTIVRLTDVFSCSARMRVAYFTLERPDRCSPAAVACLKENPSLPGSQWYLAESLFFIRHPTSPSFNLLVGVRPLTGANRSWIVQLTAPRRPVER